MTPPLMVLLLCVARTPIVQDEAAHWMTYAGADGPGAGKSIVLISGDEEYRSEEALPQLGKILSVHHGFDCRVLFAIDPDTGEINPDNRTNIPGLEALADADLMIIATRFRDLPDEQMAHIDAYLKSGKPVIGLRTATHAFNLESSETYRRYTWNNESEPFVGGFGRQVLGETWVAHHGEHGEQSTRGIAAPGAADHPILRGISGGDVWGPTDVYAVRLPLPESCTPVVLGQVLDGMTADAAQVTGEKNDPMMPIAWTKVHDGSGVGPRRVFTTTMGAATDLLAEGTRRMLVNAAYWALGMEDEIPERGCDARLVGEYAPSDFGFGGFRKGVRPADHALPTGEDGERDARVPVAGLAPGTRLVVVGNTFAERLAQSGAFDAVAHASHPNHQLVIRHAPWSADQVDLRPREMNVPTMLDWIDTLDADVVMMCFGMSESFTMTPAEFENGLRELIETIESRGNEAPGIILVSPIAREPDGPEWTWTSEFARHNESLAAITGAMQRVADDLGISFVNLFEPSQQAHAGESFQYTTNGIHPSERGSAFFVEQIARQLGWIDDVPADADSAVTAAAEELRTLAADKHWLFRLRYRATNTEYVWGRRAEPFGVVNFPPEMAQLERMMDARDRAIWALEKPSPVQVIAHARDADPIWQRTPSHRMFPEDQWSPAPVEAKGTETSLGDLDILDPEEFAKSFTLPDGYVIECFASEQDFPEFVNPLAMTFDDRGRLWAMCAPTYPHLLPGERPRCKLLIIEDDDGDGRADTCITFADELYIPTGFAIDGNAVYVGQAPDLLRLTDTDGDDRADLTEIIYSGFGMPDSHHTLSAFEWDPAGGIIMHEGVFTKSNVETPYGTRRTRDAAVWRLDPRTGRLEIMSHCNFMNPWGHVHDDYGAAILADASGGDNFSFTHVSMPFEFPDKPKMPPVMLNRGRPTAGCELIHSRHFPDDVQGSFLVNQSIGFHGTRWNRLTIEGSSWMTQSMPKDLVSCTDVNFRPVAMEIGPDGALYIADWCNPIVGHMQYSVRDPRRDNTHGRIWRVRHESRPLVDAPNVHEATIADLLEYLRVPERNTRQLARRRLQQMEWATIQSALANWKRLLDPNDPLYGRMMLEDLWIRHAHGRASAETIERVLALSDERARAGAVRVLRIQLQFGQIDPASAMPLLERAIEDENMRVRLEGVVACGFVPPADGVRIAARADLFEMDEPMTATFEEVLTYLGRGGDVVSEVLERVRLMRMPAAELLARPLDEMSAIARLSRSDLPRGGRVEALTHLAGDDPDAQAARLIELIESSRGEEVLRSIGGMLLSLPGAAARGLSDDVRRLQENADPTRRSIAAGMRLIAGAAEPMPASAERVVDALSMMAAGAAPEETLEALRDTVERGEVEPMSAIEQIVRHEVDESALREWLTGLVDAVEGMPLEPWNGAHERAMAALQALSGTLESAGDDRYRVAAASNEQFAAGEALYHDESLGCVRCHGPRGQGLEGYPALDRSSWIVGDPQRAASIVIHGLYGRLEMPDGESFDSVMDPLGEVLNDEQIASILTYVRQSWGNFSRPVAASDVARARAAGPDLGGMWQVQAIANAHPLSRDYLVPPGPTDESESGFVSFLLMLVIYIIPPTIAAGLIIWFLERMSKRP